MTEVHVKEQGPATHIVLDRPPLNILTTDLLTAFAKALRDAATREGVRAIVIRGEGKGFSAGVDVREHLPDVMGPLLDAFHDALLAVLGSDLPVVASVHGPCLGGGMELAMAADLVYAAEDAKFGQPEIKLGVFPPFAAAAYPAWFGRARTAELLLLGETWTASQAFEYGFVSGVVPAADLAAKVDDVVGKLVALSPAAVRFTREALRVGSGRGLSALDDVDTLYRTRLMRTHDAEEGLRAFLEKRPPKWRGD